MPKYSYKCSSCEDTFEVYHLMSEEYNVCDLCGSKDCITKIPSSTFSFKFDHTKEKTGDVVKKHIEEAKLELKNEKKELKNKQL